MTLLKTSTNLEANSPAHDQTSLFSNQEYATRLANLREKMSQHKMKGCLISTPEDIYYLTGLNHWGFFGLHLLIVPSNGLMTLITRQMEKVTIENQLGNRVEFAGYSDSDQPAVFAANRVKQAGLSSVRLGCDFHSLYRSYSDTQTLIDELPNASWAPIEGFLMGLRLTKSTQEIKALRQAGQISQRMTETAIKTASTGTTEQAVAAEVYKSMILAGGEPPSFGPFIRPKKRLGEEHTTWQQSTLSDNDTLFIEVAGSYQRYHAPMGRLTFMSTPPKGTDETREVCLAAFDAVVKTLRPGVTAHEVYAKWQKVVDDAGLADYKRHHCGYMVGISFPPSWMEGTNRFVSLREGSDLEIQSGMVFHVMSWLMGSRMGDYFVSNTVAVSENDCEVLTQNSR